MSTCTGTTFDSAKPVSIVYHHAKATTNPKTERNGQLAKDVNVQLQYLRNDPLYNTVKPLQVTPSFLDEEGRTNVRLETGPLEIIHDVRGQERRFTLDANGFSYVHAPTAFADWSSQPNIAKEYLPEMEQLLKREVDGCDEIVFYDARIRQSGDEGARVSGLSYNPFARQVHVDNTERSILEKIHNITDMKADYYLNGRARVINIWRPIKHPVYDCGLAIADGGKLRKGDVIECDRHRQDTGEYWDTMGVIKYRPGYDWYYMSLQDEPDVLLFKNYDSATDVQARVCLHTAFDLPPSEVPPNAPTRESIEVRALVLTHPKGLRRPSGALMPHPIALHLEQNSLKMVDEEHSITDRLRTDIDEGNEMKDAMLLLRRIEIRRLETINERFVGERGQLEHKLGTTQDQLQQARQQIDIQSNHADALQRKIVSLEQRLEQQRGDLCQQYFSLAKEMTDARMHEQTRPKGESDGVKYALELAGGHGTHETEGMLRKQIGLLQAYVEGQQAEVEKWKAEAMGKGNEAVSRCWQHSVDEAVKRERFNDAHVIKQLREEIDTLKAAGPGSNDVCLSYK